MLTQNQGWRRMLQPLFDFPLGDVNYWSRRGGDHSPTADHGEGRMRYSPPRDSTAGGSAEKSGTTPIVEINVVCENPLPST